MMPSLLIRNAQLLEGGTTAVRINGPCITAIGALVPIAGERIVDARGALLLPGLHDHHLHLAATAAARASVACGPPEVLDAAQLAEALGQHGAGWLRGVGYHESVAGLIDRHWLDRAAPDRPVRVQHRSGRMWIFNSAGLDRLFASGLTPPAGLDRLTGRLFDEDAWMRRALGGRRPSLAALGADYARLGVTGLTEMSPANGAQEHQWLAAEQASGALPQKLLLAGTPALSALDYNSARRLGPVKIHLHEAHLPDHDELISTIRAAHGQGRGVAVHCVTELELVYTLAALEEAGTHPSDRIEHASVTPDALLARIADLGLAVVTQPHFIHARGDAYRRDVPPEDWPNLYRLRAFLDASVPLAGSSDAPYAGIDPWAAMASAVSRKTQAGEILGPAEALTPEQALHLYLADPEDLRRTRGVAIGEAADLCLLDAPWETARNALSDVRVSLTLVGGQIVHDSIDQAPA